VKQLWQCRLQALTNTQAEKSSAAPSDSVVDPALAAARAEVEKLQAAAKKAEAEAARRLQQALDDLAAVLKEKDSINVKYLEKQKQLTAAAAAAEKEKGELNLKISELGAGLKAAAAKEAKMASLKSSAAVDEDKNKTIAQQSLRISQLESTMHPKLKPRSPYV
jgi:hypothetical protein